jgi:hypothetical protein
MSDGHEFGGHVKPTQSQPKMARLGETLPEFVSREQMKAQAMGPFSYNVAAPTVAGIHPPMAPGGPIAAAPHMPTPAPRNVKE